MTRLRSRRATPEALMQTPLPDGHEFYSLTTEGRRTYLKVLDIAAADARLILLEIVTKPDRVAFASEPGLATALAIETFGSAFALCRLMGDNPIWRIYRGIGGIDFLTTEAIRVLRWYDRAVRAVVDAAIDRGVP